MKKWTLRITLLLAVALLLSLTLQISSDAPRAKAAVNVWGDADGNGEITDNDALLIKQYRAGLIAEEDLLLDLCDVDSNNKVDVYDAYLVQLHAAGIIDQFPVETDPAKNYDPDYAEDPGQIHHEYLPVIYIYVPEGEWGDKKDVREGELIWMGADGTNYEFGLTIKPQGSSSLAYDKKNFTINLDDTIVIKESWGAQSEFCLKANYIDPTHAGNVVSAQLAGQMNAAYGVLDQAPNGGSVDGIPVWVNINGEPIGMYTWCIPKAAWMFGMDEENPNHFVMCGEGPLAGCNFSSESYIHDDEWSVEVGDEDAAFAAFDRLYDFVHNSSDEAFKENFEDYLDLDACLNYYCYIMITNAQDNINNNLLLATYDGRVWSPVLYDLDSLWGVRWDGKDVVANDWQSVIENSSVLWNKLRYCFAEELQERYAELRTDILSEENIWATFEAFMDSIPDPYYVYDTAMWNPDGEMIRTLDLMKQCVSEYLPLVDAFVAEELDRPNPATTYYPEYAEDPGMTVGTYLPVIYIDVPEGEWGGKTDVREGTLYWSGPDGVNYEFGLTIKPQGSSSLAYDKKNFTINLDDTIVIKDYWGEQSEFCLKANYIDPTHAGNVVSAQLVGQMNAAYDVLTQAPNGGSIDGIPVWVNINGEPIGMYTWCIPKAAWMFGMEEDTPDQYVICGEGWSEGCLFQSETYVHDTDWSVEVGDEDAAFAAFDRLYAFIQGSTNQEFKENIADYLDLDACLNYYCYTLISAAHDNMANNMLLATYDGLIWSPVLYDLDSLWGIYWTGKETCGGGEELLEFDGTLFVKLRECFWEELQERYAELRADILSEENIWATFEAFMDSIPDPYYVYDTAMWNPDGEMIRTLSLMKQQVAEYLPVLDELMGYSAR